MRASAAQYAACATSGMNARQAAEALGVKVRAVRSAAQRLGIEFAPMPLGVHLRNPVSCRGVSYPSQTVLANALGISCSTVTAHLNKGSIDRAGMGRKSRSSNIKKGITP